MSVKIKGLNNGIAKLTRLRDLIKPTAVAAMYEGGLIIKEKMLLQSNKEYTVEYDTGIGRVWIIPRIDEFELANERQKRKEWFKFTNFKCPYWKYLKPRLGRGWINNSEASAIVRSSIKAITSLIVNSIKQLLR